MRRPRRFLGLTLPLFMLACTGNARFAVQPDDECDGCAGASGVPGAGGPGAAGGLPGGQSCVSSCAGGPPGSGGAGPGGAGGSPAGGSGGGPAGAVDVRVVNFNVENLFDSVDGGGFGEAELTPTPAEYARRIDDAASVLALESPDIVALEEVENRNVVLDDLADKLEEKRPGVTYPERWLIEGNDRVRNVALLSTVPVVPTEVVSHRDERFDAQGVLSPGGEFTFTRDALEVTLRYRGYPVTLFVVHFKAKSNDDPARRLAEARRTRRLVDEKFAADPNARVLVLGDFNDTPGSAPMLALSGGVGGAPQPLSSGVSLLPPHLAWTHPFGNGPNNGQLIDDQLASPSMAQARVPASISVWHDNDPGFPPNLRPVSDHSPVAITYRLGDAPLGP